MTVADNYLQFSAVLSKLTKKEEAWLKEQLQPICVFGNKEYPEDAVPAELAGREAEWTGLRFLRDNGDYDPDCDCLGFEWSLSVDADRGGWGRHLWVYAEESGNPDNVAWLVQKFLKKFRPQECWSLSYAATCSKPRVNEFGGGAVFVTAAEIKWQNAYGFIEDQRAAFEAKRSKTHRTKKGKKR
jgi:hypothetical protein